MELSVDEETRVARIDKDFHGLPPDPEDELKSIIKSSQDPNILGIEMTNTGEIGFEGDEIVIL